MTHIVRKDGATPPAEHYFNNGGDLIKTPCERTKLQKKTAAVEEVEIKLDYRRNKK